MPFTIRPSRRFPVQCAVLYNPDPFHGQGIVWKISCAGGLEWDARVAWKPAVLGSGRSNRSQSEPWNEVTGVNLSGGRGLI